MAFSDIAREDDETNRQHSLYPEVGDYWHEMYTPIAVVVDVSDFVVTT